MAYRERRGRPADWAEYRTQAKHGWTVPLLAMEWVWEWAAHFLSTWAFLETLGYLSNLGVLVAVIFYFAEAGERRRQRHFQMWQVMNTAQGKGGSGGRIEALEELNRDRVSLVGVDVSGAFLRGVKLPKAELLRANFSSVDARNGDFTEADFSFAEMQSGNFRNGKFARAILRDADCAEGDFSGADFSGADLTRADFSNADLHDADLLDVQWKGIVSVKMANIYGLKNAPAGFVAWALKNGAVQTAP
ncbi:MAG TPA: pentapeptide repeat-containing protein [Candidatus Acidoferrum sp.]|nr:pentapeptide repeat-containing protein [Candidatus Acidoferrum sp.]